MSTLIGSTHSAPFSTHRNGASAVGWPVLLFALSLLASGCSAAVAAYGNPAPPEVEARKTIVLSIEPSSMSVGHRLYSRLFDLMMDDATRDRVVWPSAPAGGGLSSAVSDSLMDVSPQLRVDSLSFSINGTRDRLGVGSVVEGRQFLIARAYYSLEAEEGDRGRSGYSIGRANFNAADGGVTWEAYLGALASLAEAIVQDAGLPRP